MRYEFIRLLKTNEVPSGAKTISDRWTAFVNEWTEKRGYTIVSVLDEPDSVRLLIRKGAPAPSEGWSGKLLQGLNKLVSRIESVEQSSTEGQEINNLRFTQTALETEVQEFRRRDAEREGYVRRLESRLKDLEAKFAEVGAVASSERPHPGQ